MINSWFKLRHIICPQHPKVGKMARALGCNRMTAYGVACAWFRYVDMFTTDGYTHLKPDELDEELGFRGCTDALSLVVWAALDSSGCVMAPNFDEHCGETAKTRAMNARYKENHNRKKKIFQGDDEVEEKNLPQNSDTGRKKSYQNREEKNREEKTICGEETCEGINTQQGEIPLSSSPSRPSDEQEVLSFLSSQPHAMLPDSELRSCAERFFLSGQASGWYYKNAPLSDWRASCRLYLSRWVDHYRRNPKTPPTASLNANIYG